MTCPIPFVGDPCQGLSDLWANLWAGVSDYLYLGKYLAIGLAILAVAMLLSWFFGALPVIGKWIRGVSGLVVVSYGLFLTGMIVMFKHMRARRKEPDPQPEPTEPEPGKPWKPWQW